LVNRDRVLTTNYEGDERTNKHSSIDDEYSDQDLEDFRPQKSSDNDDNEMHSFETEKYRYDSGVDRVIRKPKLAVVKYFPIRKKF